MPTKHHLTTSAHCVEVDIVKGTSTAYMSVKLETDDFNSLLEAMQYQASKNKEVCDEIIAKQAAFEAQYKPKKAKGKK